ncbi:Rpn family recombination-promoting nuclease/putative transposase [Hespellia stercorisuis]|uniref:PD-(D/E)XK nuclease family transposase n=1 Tax=Hespellia stercorisuis DSM 15480 TaxID=1121950 RepID=A0A1M6NYZ1_9FIRM|nr:Rpn family recombination-promoting nuclease/putative transposase [Hespellia stercorisuis]SHK00935.1 conserved hypothetical protein (putative transposase or invertase) [Hespellia stercorisuis DSM 15480]
MSKNLINTSKIKFSRTYCNLPRGGSYADILPCIHIGILNFSLFPDTADPYAEYLLSNTKTHQVYSDKFSIRVLDLTQIETGQLQKEKPELYYWAKLFIAKTWEEMQMLSEKSEGIQEAVLTLKELTEDEKIQLQCEAREMYEHTMASAERFGRIAGKREGKIEGKRETAEKMLRDGMDEEQIQKYTGLSQKDIEDIRHTVK